jgi:hypothetical protein
MIRFGDTYHGISVFGRGMFTNHGHTYAGQYRDGHACGLGVLMYRNGIHEYAEHGPDGKYDGRNLLRWTDGETTYRLFERGEQKEYADVDAGGRCTYNGEGCAPDDPRLLALVAQIAPVEVRRAAPGPPPATRPQGIFRWIGRLVLPLRRRWRPPWPPRCTPTPHTVARGHATQPKSSRTAKHAHAVTRARTVLPQSSHGLMHPSGVWCTPMGPSGQLAAMPLA